MRLIRYCSCKTWSKHNLNVKKNTEILKFILYIIDIIILSKKILFIKCMKIHILQYKCNLNKLKSNIYFSLILYMLLSDNDFR